MIQPLGNKLYFVVVVGVALFGCDRTAPNPTSNSRQLATSTDTYNNVVRSEETDSVTPQEATTKLSATDPLKVPKVLASYTLVGPLVDAYSRIDPKKDGWDSEVFGDAASAQLKEVSHILESRSGVDTSTLVSQEFVAPSIIAAGSLKNEFHDDSLQVSRIQGPLLPSGGSKGTQRLKDLTDEFRSLFAGAPHVKFKLYRVVSNGAEVETFAYFHADGASAKGPLEITSNWKILWWTPPNAAPQITSIQIDECELVQKTEGSETLFADVTASVLSSEESYKAQLLRSTDYWRSRLCRDHGLDVVANHGLAIGDVNGDMLEDLYICQQGGLPNRLYVQREDGTLQDVSAQAGVDWLDYSASALLIDVDNDGDRDLVVSHETQIVFMSNDGKGKFELKLIVPNQAQTFSLAAADFDKDGDLDIYCCGYNHTAEMTRTGAMGEPMPYHDAQNGGPNLLLANQGNWRFTDATGEVGLAQNNNRFSFAASWEDYDNDGDLDLYVANDYGRNNLYRNEQGKFTDIAAELDVQDMSAGMSVSWADANRDGWMDFYVSNMFSAAGNRITYQRQFKDSTSGDIKRQYQRHARGNSLFQSNGKGGFQDVSVAAGITMGRWAWGSRFCDLNNDGWQDIVVNNGFITTEDTGDL